MSFGWIFEHSHLYVVMFLSSHSCISSSDDPCRHTVCRNGAECRLDPASRHATCVCPKRCPVTGNSARLCGSDSVTYNNECEMRRTACLHQTVISVRHMGSCGEFLARIWAARWLSLRNALWRSDNTRILVDYDNQWTRLDYRLKRNRSLFFASAWRHGWQENSIPSLKFRNLLTLWSSICLHPVTSLINSGQSRWTKVQAASKLSRPCDQGMPSFDNVFFDMDGIHDN